MRIAAALKSSPKADMNVACPCSIAHRRRSVAVWNSHAKLRASFPFDAGFALQMPHFGHGQFLKPAKSGM
jgi:hypothetical protein